MEDIQKPVVMCFSGLDATGGAGIQADIESLASHGCHCAPVITAHTLQDTQAARSFETVSMDSLIASARAVLEDMPVSAFKIGMLGDVPIAEAIHSLLRDYPDLPVVYDPVMAAGAGGSLSAGGLVDAIKALIIPHTTLITPNTPEIKQLTIQADTRDGMAHELQDMGCENVLITGTHASTPDVEHHLYMANQPRVDYSYERLPHAYHGSGCTLAASIAALMAHGDTLEDAVHQGLDYTWKTLKYAERLGMGQLIPNRYYWVNHP